MDPSCFLSTAAGCSMTWGIFFLAQLRSLNVIWASFIPHSTCCDLQPCWLCASLYGKSLPIFWVPSRITCHVTKTGDVIRVRCTMVSWERHEWEADKFGANAWCSHISLDHNLKLFYNLVESIPWKVHLIMCPMWII